MYCDEELEMFIVRNPFVSVTELCNKISHATSIYNINHAS